MPDRHTGSDKTTLCLLVCSPVSSRSGQGHVVGNLVLRVGDVAVWSPSLVLKRWPVSRVPRAVQGLVEELCVR